MSAFDTLHHVVHKASEDFINISMLFYDASKKNGGGLINDIFLTFTHNMQFPVTMVNAVHAH